jgi:hypothetical protein
MSWDGCRMPDAGLASLKKQSQFEIAAEPAEL